MIKFIFLFSVLVSIGNVKSQMLAFQDFNLYLKSYSNGYFRQIEQQQIQSLTQGDNIMAYTDIKFDFKIYDGGNPILIANVNVEYKVSDAIVAWSAGPTIMYYSKGKKEQLTFFGRNYEVKDSMIIYEDMRFNSIIAVMNGKSTTLMSAIGDIVLPDCMGENIAVFRDNGDFYKVFWNNQIYDIDVWNTRIEFQAGTDVMAYNDPISRTFTIFYQGGFYEGNSMYAKKFKCGNGFVVFEDQNGNLKMWSPPKDGIDEKIIELSSYSADSWDARDFMVYWTENSYTKCYYNDKIHTLASYKTADIQIKNSTIAWRNIMGGCSVFSKGILTEASNIPNVQFSINSDYVLCRQKGFNPIIVDGGKIMR